MSHGHIAGLDLRSVTKTSSGLLQLLGGGAMRPLVLDPTKLPIRAPTVLGAHHARHALSRRAFMGSMASVAGAAMGASLLPISVLAAKPSSSAPKPTPN